MAVLEIRRGVGNYSDKPRLDLTIELSQAPNEQDYGDLVSAIETIVTIVMKQRDDDGK